MITENKILVLGVGNDILSDDAIGPKIAKRLESLYQNSGIKFDTVCVGGMEIVEYIQGYDIVVFIDAIKTQDGIPGDVYFITPEAFKETSHLSSVHDVSFLTALELARTLNMHVPHTIHIIAIEIVEDLLFSNDFSPQIQEKYEEIFHTIQEELPRLMLLKNN